MRVLERYKLTVKRPLVNSGMTIRASRLSCGRLTFLLFLVRCILVVRGELCSRKGVEVVGVVAGACATGFVTADAECVLVLGLAAFETVWVVCIVLK